MSAQPGRPSSSRRLEQLELAIEWARRHPCPAQDTRPTGVRSTCTVRAWSRSPAPVPRGWRSSHRRTWPRRSGISHDAARQLIADALELSCRLPRLGPGPSRRGPGLASPPDCSGDRGPQRRGGSCSRTGSSPPRLSGSVRCRRPGWSRRPGSTSTPTAPSMTNSSPCQARRLAASHRRTRDHRRGDDPGHPRRTAVRPDHHRIAGDLRELVDTENLDIRRAREVGILADPQDALDRPSGRDRAAPGRGARAGADHPLRSSYASRPRSTIGAASIEKLGAATIAPAHRPAHPIRRAGAKITLRLVLDLNTDWAVDETSHPKQSARFVLRAPTRLPRPPPRLPSRDLDHITEYVPMDDGGPPGQTRPAISHPFAEPTTG